jgi:DNA-directed RNA polymerase subunit F
MILEKTPLTIAEVKELTKDIEEAQQLKDYIKAFSKLTKEKADSLTSEIRALNNIKIKESNIVKICDFLPKEAEELNKIFTEVSLSEEEIKSVLNVTTKY